MQSLRSTSVRRLCLSVTASVTRRPTNPLFPALACLRQSFTSPSTRWYSSTGQFHHQVTEETGEETPSEVEEARRPKSPTGTLFLGNLPYSTTDDELREVLSVYGPLSRIAIARDREGQHRGYAHVDFESKQDAVKVFEDHSESPITIEDRELRVGHAYPTRASSLRMRTVKDRFDPSSHIFVGKLPYEATREDIREALKRFGLITDVRVALDGEGTSKGFAHVEFASTAEAEKALEYYTLNSFYILDQEVRMDRASPPKVVRQASLRLDFAKWEENGASLRSHFGALRSKIVRIHFAKNPHTGFPTGPGFLEFRDAESAREALRRFNTPELGLAPSRPGNYPSSRPVRHFNFGLRPQKERD